MRKFVVIKFGCDSSRYLYDLITRVGANHLATFAAGRYSNPPWVDSWDC